MQIRVSIAGLFSDLTSVEISRYSVPTRTPLTCSAVPVSGIESIVPG